MMSRADSFQRKRYLVTLARRLLIILGLAPALKAGFGSKQPFVDYYAITASLSQRHAVLLA